MSVDRAFVTGGTGFIGAHLIRRLLSDGVEVHALIRPESDLWRLEEVLSEIYIYRGYLEDLEHLSTLIAQANPIVVFHLAADGVIPFQRTESRVLFSNVVGTFNLLQASKNIDYEAFIHVGSSTEYGSKNKEISEGDILEPVSFFAATKACGTLLAQQFAREYKKPLSILRVFSVYGPLESPHRLIPTAIKAALEEDSIRLTEPHFARDLIFVEDVVGACMLSWKKRVLREILNIGTGKETTNGEIISCIEAITKKKIHISGYDYPPRATDTRNWKANACKMERLLGYKPRSLEDGLKQTIERFMDDQCCCSAVSKSGYN